MPRLLLACSLTTALSVAATAIVIDYRAGRIEPTEHLVLGRMRSTVLGEDREFIVRLPDSYTRELSRRYPVIYVLDGSSLDAPTADSAAILARIGLSPELIVVGLPNVSGAGRERDYTPPFMRQDIDTEGGPMGEADRFLDFLERELIPLIERDYRAAPLRLLSGHSRGGLLVCYSLMAKPALFGARFAHSPALWRDDQALVARASTWLAGASPLDGFLYLSIGSDEVPRMRSAFDSLRAVLTERAAAVGLRWQADVVPGANHQTNGPWATPLGLKAYFAGPAPAAHR